MSTYIRYANAIKLMINNAVYIITFSLSDFFEPVDAFEEKPEAGDAAKQADSKTDCKQIHFPLIFKS